MPSNKKNSKLSKIKETSSGRKSRKDTQTVNRWGDLESWEEVVRRGYHIQTVLNGLLRISLEDISLKDMLDKVLNRVASIPWLALESKGCIFLIEDNPGALVLKAEHGMPESFKATCGRVPLGRCICGLAAKSVRTEFRDRVDERHHNRYQGMPPHGDYCVPIISSNKRLLGVLNLRLREGHRRDEKEEAFLGAVADILAGIIHRKQAEQALRESEERYRTLFESSIEAFGISQGNRIVACNKALLDLLGYGTIEEVSKIPLTNHIAPQHREMIRQRIKKRARGKPVPAKFEHKLIRKDGKIRDVEILTNEVIIDDEKYVLGSFRDITEHKSAERKLKQTTEQLAIERETLERKNVALREILNQIDEEKNALKRHLVTNVEQAIIPTLIRLKKSARPFQKRIFQILESDLREIISPFLDTIRSKYTRLSPRELEVCRLIRDGMTSKEIAGALHISPWTVYKHRELIRKKLGLVNDGTNLRTYLRSM